MTFVRIFLLLLVGSVAVRALPFRENHLRQERDTEEVNYRLPTNVLPARYDIRLNPHMKGTTFDGETSVEIEIKEPTREIVLHAGNLTINESATTLRRKDDEVHFTPEDHRYDLQTEKLFVRFPETLEPGVYTISFMFTGFFQNYAYELNGFYKSYYLDDDNNRVWIASTHFQPTTARHAFPCWDEPAFKAHFDVSIKHHTNYTALSNMPQIAVSGTDPEDEKVWTRFATTPRLPTNLVAFVVSDYGYVQNKDGSTKAWCRKNALPSVEYVPDFSDKIMLEIERYTDFPLAMTEMKHVAIPAYSTSATEHWGIITYWEYVLLHDSNSTGFNHKVRTMLTIAHELAHQWFGNLITHAWWRYMWLSEGITTYYKHYFIDQVYKNWRTMDVYVTREASSLLEMDSREYLDPIDKEVNSPEEIRLLYSPTTYRKSSFILHMLLHSVSDSVFRSGIRKYIRTHQHGAVTSDDLWKAMQDAVDESSVPYEGFKVKEAMDAWIKQTGFPLITVARDYVTGEVTVSQKVYWRNNTDGVGDRSWWVPINYATQTNPDFSSTLPVKWLKPEDESIKIDGVDKDDWIILNVQKTGYYRVNYDMKNWKKIADYLNSDNYTNIHALNRAQLLDDAFDLIASGRLHPVVFLELTRFLARETDYVVWNTAFTILEKVETDMVKGKATPVESYILHLMQKLIDNLDFDRDVENDYLADLMQTELIKWTCKLNYTPCKMHATAKLSAHLSNPEKHKVKSNEKEWVYCSGLAKANETLWDMLFSRLETTDTRDMWGLLSYLGCSENPDILNKYLTQVLAATSLPQYVDMFEGALAGVCMNSPVGTDVAVDFVISNWEKIVANPELPESVLRKVIWRIDTLEQSEKIRKFLKDHEIDDMDSRLAAREEEIAESSGKYFIVHEWLKNPSIDFFTDEDEDDSDNTVNTAETVTEENKDAQE